MPELDRATEYVRSQLLQRLPSGVGAPLPLIDERDLTIVSDERFFDQVATNALGNNNQAALPGLGLSHDEQWRKITQGVAVARAGKGVMYLERVMTATYAQDTARSLFRLVRSGLFIPVDVDDTPDSLYMRTSDYMENLFAAAALARIPASRHTRDKGMGELRKRFVDREPSTVLDIAVLTGRNNARLTTMWLDQLDTTTKGYKHLPRATRDLFGMYAVQRPVQYWKKPDLMGMIASRSLKKGSRPHAA